MKNQNVQLVLNMLKLENVDSDTASPNFVADFAYSRGIDLSSLEVVQVSNCY